MSKYMVLRVEVKIGYGKIEDQLFLGEGDDITLMMEDGQVYKGEVECFDDDSISLCLKKSSSSALAYICNIESIEVN